MSELDIYASYIESLPKETRKIYVTHRFGEMNGQTAHIFSYNYELKECTMKTLDYKFFELRYNCKQFIKLLGKDIKRFANYIKVLIMKLLNTFN